MMHAALIASTCAVLACPHPVADDRPLSRAEWRASTYTSSAQTDAALAVMEGGGSLVVWTSRRQQVGSYGVYGQRFDGAGVAIGEETQINLWTRSHQFAPDAAATRDGGAWVVWQSHGQDGHAGSIIARRFGPGFVGGEEILVNETWRGEQASPVIAARPDGSAIVAWESVEPGAPRRVTARLLGADGAPLGPEFIVARSDDGAQTTPAVAVREDGSFAIAWTAFEGPPMLPAGVRVRAFDPEGIALGTPSAVTAAPAASQIEPALAATDDGYVVAWLDAESDGDDYGVLARLLDARAVPTDAAPVVVSGATPGPQTGAAVAVAPDGTIAVAFNGLTDGEPGVFGRLFSASLAARSGEFRVTERSEGPQTMRTAAATARLAFAPDGTMLCAWSGDGGLGDSSAAHVTMLAESLPEPAGERGVTEAMKPALPDRDEDGRIVLAQGPGPHEPPTFDPRDIEHAEREFEFTPRGVGFTAITSTGWTPPDPHMAVGPGHVVVMTNGAIAFFQKDGTKTFQDEIEDSFGFWGSVGATGFVFDPEVLYDELTGRFFAMAAEAYAPGNRSYVLIAVSDDSNPNGTWYKYRLETTGLAGNLFDSPNIGVTDDAVVVTGDGFGLGSNYPVYIFDKASMLAGSPPAITKSFTLTTSTQSAGIPPVSYDNPPALYLIEHREQTSNTSVRLIAIRNLLTTPVVTDYSLGVPTYGRPENPPQLGTSVRPTAFDARFWSVAYRNGSLWATHHINSDRVLARWYEVAMNGWPTSGNNPTLVQSGNVDLGPTVRTYFSSITVADDGSAAVCYARSSPTEYISMGLVYRLPCDPPGTMGSPITLVESNAPYQTSRWGDYSAVEVDPVDGRTFWAHHEYNVNGSWRTWVASVGPERCFCEADLNQDGTTDTLDFLVYLNRYAAGDPSADLNGDTKVDTMDFLLFLNLWTACRG
ncbi:MAG: dockerin type I repeat-containing protein [Phycisphaerales bacterium]|nr:dockerin type I repeat-containing protein [Phycisphaerales bacterium]